MNTKHIAWLVITSAALATTGVIITAICGALGVNGVELRVGRAIGLTGAGMQLFTVAALVYHDYI